MRHRFQLHAVSPQTTAGQASRCLRSRQRSCDRVRLTVLAFVVTATSCRGAADRASEGASADVTDIVGPPGTGTSLGPVTDLAVIAGTTRLAPGDSMRLLVTARDPSERRVDGQRFAWVSDHPAVLTVDGTGLVRAQAAGTAVVTVSTRDASYEVALSVARADAPIVVRPGTDIQALVDRAAPGASFRLVPGVYRRQHIVPKDGMAFVGDAGAVLDGESVTDYAFRNDLDSLAPRNVLVRGLEIRHYVPELQYGAVRADAGMGGWVIDSCDIHDNATGGVRVGDHTRVLHSRVHHNGKMGVLGGGDDIHVEGNEIAYNNADARFDMYDEAGGTKFTRTRDLVVRDNFVHHNHGPGLWTDIDNVRTLYDRNRVEDNAEAGIFHEISYAATIRDNVVRRNGTHAVPEDWITGAGILLGVSRDVDVYGNTVEDNRHGITAFQQVDRGTGRFGAYVLANNRVHDNAIVMRRGVTGVATGGWRRLIDRVTYDPRGNRFWSNRYRLLGPGKEWFFWRGARRTAEEWRAFGQDSGSTITR